MPDQKNLRPEELEAVRTTIVGGRPPGCGKHVGQIPRGIEVLVKKAAIDTEFRQLLLTQRGRAAQSIGLELSAAESMMLSTVPVAQLEAIIRATTVPESHVPAFLGKVAAVMLAALGIFQSGVDAKEQALSRGIRPEDQKDPRDNIAATSRPATPAKDEEQPMVIAGAVIVRPQSRPATQPTTQPTVPDVRPVAGITPGIAGATVTPPIRVAGLMAEPPATRPAPDQIRILGERPDMPAVFGARVDRPPQEEVIKGIRVDRPDDATAPLTVYGLQIDRPQDIAVRGVRIDRPRPTTGPTTAPSKTSEANPPAENLIVGIQPIRPPDQRIRGLRVDRPETGPTPVPADDAQKQQPIQPVRPQERFIGGIQPARPNVWGLEPDRPAVPPTAPEKSSAEEESAPPEGITVLGIRPVTPPRKPTTQPTPQSKADAPSALEPPVIVAGLMIQRPPAEPLSRGIRPDRPKAPSPTSKPTSQPSTQPAANAEFNPDFPVAIDGIRPDRPEKRDQ